MANAVGRPRTRNGMGKTRIYQQWNSMMQRCHNTKNPQYLSYGGRGILVCDRWRDNVMGFYNFMEDMGECPDDLSLDRMNNNKGYSKKNCRWATRIEQKANCRNNVQIHYGGETKCIEVWSREKDLDVRIVSQRYHRGVRLPELFNPTPKKYVDYNANHRARKEAGLVKPRAKKLAMGVTA
jgi:hypothetical protein